MTRARPLDLVLSRNRKLLHQCIKAFGQRIGFRIAKDVTDERKVKLPNEAALKAEPEYRGRGGISMIDLLCRAIALVSVCMMLFFGVVWLFDEHWT